MVALAWLWPIIVTLIAIAAGFDVHAAAWWSRVF